MLEWMQSKGNCWREYKPVQSIQKSVWLWLEPRQKQSGKIALIGFWFLSWKDAEAWYTDFEQQLMVTDKMLQQYKSVSGSTAITVEIAF